MNDPSSPAGPGADRNPHVAALARPFLERGDFTGWFEALYRAERGREERIPWADARTHPLFRAWIEARHAARPARTGALVVGCGLGEEAVQVASRGFRTTAFDVSPTAIQWCRERFPALDPAQNIDWRVCDLFAPPAEWLAAFDLVVEVFTVQALPPSLRERACAAIAALVAPGGTLLVVARASASPTTSGGPPWPLARAELAAFRAAGLLEERVEEWELAQDHGGRMLRAQYVRAAEAP